MIDNHGGTLSCGSISSPSFSYTLPPGDYLASGSGGVITNDDDDRTFKVWQTRIVSSTTAMTPEVASSSPAASTRSWRSWAGIGSHNIERTRDHDRHGHRAVIVDIAGRSDVQPPCWTNPDTGEPGMILQWAEHADVNATWATELGGEAWPIVVTEVDGHTLVIENIHGANVLDQDVLDSIRFLDALPSPPTS